MQGWDTNAFRDRLPEDGLGHHECYDLGSETHTLPCHCCCWTCLTLTPLPWPCMPKWMQWRMAGEQQMMASVALMSTTAANIALSWLTFIEQAEKGARGDVATKKVIELLSSERICNDIAGELEFLPENGVAFGAAAWSLLAATRVEMELRVRDMACPIYLGTPWHRRGILQMEGLLHCRHCAIVSRVESWVKKLYSSN